MCFLAPREYLRTKTPPGRGPHPAPSPGHHLLAWGTGFCSGFAQVSAGVLGDTWVRHTELLSERRTRLRPRLLSGPRLLQLQGGGPPVGQAGFPGAPIHCKGPWLRAPYARQLSSSGHSLCAAFRCSCDTLSASEPMPLPCPQGDPRLSVSCVTARERGWRRPGSLATRGRTSLARAWLTSTHTPLLLNYCLQGAGGGDTKTNLPRGDKAVQKRHGAAGRVHSSPTGWFRAVGERAPRSSGRRSWAGH